MFREVFTNMLISKTLLPKCCCVRAGLFLLVALLPCPPTTAVLHPSGLRHHPPRSGSSTQFPGLQALIARTKAATAPNVQEAAVSDLIRRLLPPPEAARFSFTVSPETFPDGAIDTARIQASSDKVLITGNSGTACTFALYHYLKYYCGCSFTWSAQQMAIPAVLPTVDITVQKADWLHYYQNVCTYGYSFVWWDWERWEMEIDWMALQGINFPLAFTGQEEIWRRVYTDIGLNDTDLASFFTGPAFLPWNRMGNIFNWAGPLPLEWMSDQNDLQHKILDRMRSLGMIPILPAFNGIVPLSVRRIYPNISLTRLSNWAGFPDDMSGSYFLNPDEPLFQKLASSFLSEMTKEYGFLGHFYNTDTFNEQSPVNSSTWDAAFIKKTTVTTYAGMRSVDPDAVWVMQGWMLIYDTDFWTQERMQALLTAVPVGSMLMLDLYAEISPAYVRTSWFYGQPFIWCMLHNFGGVFGLYGRLGAVNTGPVITRTAANSTMIGVGLSMEGINQNDIVYEFMNEMSWRSQSTDLDVWVANYSARRYGGQAPQAQQAYHILQKTVYDTNRTFPNTGRYAVSQRPAFNLTEYVWYDSKDLLPALQLLLDCPAQIPPSGLPGLLYDIVDVTRQVLQNSFYGFYQQYQAAFEQNKIEATGVYGGMMLKVLADMEAILQLHPKFRLEPWLRMAVSWARNDNQSAFYEWNARNQLTIWGPSGQELDYATKQWSGMVSQYYVPRWSLFIQRTTESLTSGKPFDQAAFDTEVFNRIELPFTHARSLPTEVSKPMSAENILSIAGRLMAKYDALSPVRRCRTSALGLSDSKRGASRAEAHFTETCFPQRLVGSSRLTSGQKKLEEIGRRASTADWSKR